MRNWINLVSAPRVLYHVSDRSNRESIFQNGLLRLHSETAELAKSMDEPEWEKYGGIFFSDTYRKPDNTEAYDIWEVDTLGLPLARDETTEHDHLGEKWYVDWESDRIDPDRLNLLSDRIMENKQIIDEENLEESSYLDNYPLIVSPKKSDLIAMAKRVGMVRGSIIDGTFIIGDGNVWTHKEMARKFSAEAHKNYEWKPLLFSYPVYRVLDDHDWDFADFYTTPEGIGIMVPSDDGLLPPVDKLFPRATNHGDYEQVDPYDFDYDPYYGKNPTKTPELTEAPIADISHIGNWEKNSSYGTQDRKLLTAPKAVAKIKAMWKYPEDVDFNILLINNAEARNWFEEGIVERDKLATMFPKTIAEIEPLIRSDQVNILYTNNKGAERVPMTGWIMAHRYGHALMRGGKSHYFVEAHQVLDRYLTDLMEAYGVRSNSSQSRFSSGYQSKTPTLENPITIKLAQEIFTFRAAREKNLRNPHEALHELLAQFMITGKIGINPLPRQFKWKNGFYRYQLSDEDYKQDCHTIEHDLTYELQSYFETAMHYSVGKILVM